MGISLWIGRKLQVVLAPNPPRSQVLLVLFVALLVTGGAVWSGRKYFAALSHEPLIRKYSTTTGVIKTLEFQSIAMDELYSLDTPIVLYEYTVDGIQYQSRRVATVQYLMPNRPEFDAIYAVGKRVSIYYDPKLPANSLLMPSLSEGSVRGLRDLFFILSGLCIFLWAGLILGFCQLVYKTREPSCDESE